MVGDSVLMSRPLSVICLCCALTFDPSNQRSALRTTNSQRYLAKQLLAVESSGSWPLLPQIDGLVEVDEHDEHILWKGTTDTQLKEWRDRQSDSLGRFAFYKDAPVMFITQS